MNKKYEKKLYENLEIIFRNSENIYKLANIIKKYCDLKTDSKDLYEVSCVIDIITDSLSALSLDLYRASMLMINLH